MPKRWVALWSSSTNTSHITLLMPLQLVLVQLPEHLLYMLYIHLAVILRNRWDLWKSCPCSLTNSFFLSTCWRGRLVTPLSPRRSLFILLLSAGLAAPALSQFQLLWDVRDWTASQWLALHFGRCYCNPAHWQGETLFRNHSLWCTCITSALTSSW